MVYYERGVKMAPKQKITKEKILEIGFELAKKKGIDSVNSRSIAKELCCSTQPVFSHYSTMEELRKAVFDYACKSFIKEILIFEQQPDFFPQVTKWVIELARNKPHLFHLLYLSGEFKGNILIDVMMDFESNKNIVKKMEELYSLDSEECKDILLRSFLFLVGIGTMICVNHMEFSDKQIAIMMKKTVSDMVLGIKRGGQ